MAIDFGNKVISEEQALSLIKSFAKSTIYLRTSIFSEEESFAVYTSFTASNIPVDTEVIYIYGKGKDQIIINKRNVKGYEQTPDGGLKIKIETGDYSQYIYMNPGK